MASLTLGSGNKYLFFAISNSSFCTFIFLRPILDNPNVPVTYSLSFTRAPSLETALPIGTLPIIVIVIVISLFEDVKSPPMR